MRTLRLSLAGTVFVALLGGLSGAVAAQDDPMAPALVTGTVTPVGEASLGSPSFGDDVIVFEGVSATNRWEASDPRLSGTSTYTGDWQEYLSAGFVVKAGTRVIENDDGRWVGTATALQGERVNTDTVVLHGEGAYEGLTAYVLMWDPPLAPQATFDAAIFSGEMPEFPEPPAE